MLQLTLNNLERLKKKRKKVGRGGSRGGTSGKGHKGQKARSGPKIKASFEGGQMPLVRRLPKRGFTNARFKSDIQIVNIQTLDTFFEDGATITRQALLEKKLVKGKVPFSIKILGNGDLTKSLTVEADFFSKRAIEAIENKGGAVRLTKES